MFVIVFLRSDIIMKCVGCSDDLWLWDKKVVTQSSGSFSALSVWSFKCVVTMEFFRIVLRTYKWVIRLNFVCSKRCVCINICIYPYMCIYFRGNLVFVACSNLGCLWYKSVESNRIKSRVTVTWFRHGNHVSRFPKLPCFRMIFKEILKYRASCGASFIHVSFWTVT